MYIIVNKRGERLFQYGAFTFESDAYRVLRKALEKNPVSGARIKFVEDSEPSKDE